MTKIYPQYKRSTVYAMIGMLFHFLLVVLPFSFFIYSGGIYGGKLIQIYFYFVFFVVYFPFSFINSVFTIHQLLSQLGISGETNNLIAVAIVGSILYTLSGWLIGFLTDKYLQGRSRKLGSDLPEKITKSE